MPCCCRLATQQVQKQVQKAFMWLWHCNNRNVCTTQPRSVGIFWFPLGLVNYQVYTDPHSGKYKVDNHFSSPSSWTSLSFSGSASSRPISFHPLLSYFLPMTAQQETGHKNNKSRTEHRETESQKQDLNVLWQKGNSQPNMNLTELLYNRKSSVLSEYEGPKAELYCEVICILKVKVRISASSEEGSSVNSTTQRFDRISQIVCSTMIS